MHDESSDEDPWGNSSSWSSTEMLGNGTPSEFQYTKTNYLSLKYATAVFYLVTFLFGIIGNTLTIYVIVRNPAIRNKSVSNYYILNLAAADELYVATLPFLGHATYTNEWIFGQIVCKISSVLRECNKSASVLTLMALSIDRYLATYHNVTRFRQINVGVGICTAIWVIGLACATPYMIFSRSVIDMYGRVSCRPFTYKQMSPHAVRQLWVYGHLIVGMVFPFTVIATFNVLLVRRLRTLARSAADRMGQLRSRMSSSMFRLVLAIVIIFMACQLPYHIMEIVSFSYFEQYTMNHKTASIAAAHIFVYFNAVAQVLVFVSSCCNPIVYGIFNKNYRNLYLQVLCCRVASIHSKRRESTFGDLLVVSREAHVSLDRRVIVGTARCGLLSSCCRLRNSSTAAAGATENRKIPIRRGSFRSPV